MIVRFWGDNWTLCKTFENLGNDRCAVRLLLCRWRRLYIIWMPGGNSFVWERSARERRYSLVHQKLSKIEKILSRGHSHRNDWPNGIPRTKSPNSQFELNYCCYVTRATRKEISERFPHIELKIRKIWHNNRNWKPVEQREQAIWSKSRRKDNKISHTQYNKSFPSERNSVKQIAPNLERRTKIHFRCNGTYEECNGKQFIKCLT